VDSDLNKITPNIKMATLGEGVSIAARAMGKNVLLATVSGWLFYFTAGVLQFGKLHGESILFGWINLIVCVVAGLFFLVQVAVLAYKTCVLITLVVLRIALSVVDEPTRSEVGRAIVDGWFGPKPTPAPANEPHAE
jgi:hypothetical protein